MGGTPQRSTTCVRAGPAYMIPVHLGEASLALHRASACLKRIEVRKAAFDEHVHRRGGLHDGTSAALGAPIWRVPVRVSESVGNLAGPSVSVLWPISFVTGHATESDGLVKPPPSWPAHPPPYGPFPLPLRACHPIFELISLPGAAALGGEAATVCCLR